jgi:hypothetical protein
LVHEPSAGGAPRHDPTRHRALAIVVAVLALAMLPARAVLLAQQTDSSRVGATARRPATPQVDTTRPPISPRRAFLYSLLVPGSAQSILQRPNVGAIFFGFEVAGIALAAKAANDLRYARAHARDSIVLRYEVDAVTGLPVLDDDGNPKVAEYARNRYAGQRVKARRTHLEDWYALLAFNHLFAGAEAFVAAQLWDLPAHVGFRLLPSGESMIMATVPW